MDETQEFGGYVLEKRLAAGGMAEIYQARRVGAAGFSRPVCIKRILKTHSSDREFVEMFIDEARTGAQLRHGNIVGIDDFGHANGSYYLCMELVAGVDLARLTRWANSTRQRLPVDVAAHIGIELLNALDYAHRKLDEAGRPMEIVHRDVSPHNILLSHSGEVKLTDFGIARAASRLHRTAGYVIKGKLAYMAPEQARGARLDARADLFAVGVVLYEIFAGRRPFVGETEGELALAVVRGDRPPLRSLRPDVSNAMETLIDRLLQVDPERRCASASEALERLDGVQQNAAATRTLGIMVDRCTSEPWPSRQAPAEGSAPFAATEVSPSQFTELPDGATAALPGDSTVIEPGRRNDAPAVERVPTRVVSSSMPERTVVLAPDDPDHPAPHAHIPRETSPTAVTRTMHDRPLDSPPAPGTVPTRRWWLFAAAAVAVASVTLLGRILLLGRGP